MLLSGPGLKSYNTKSPEYVWLTIAWALENPIITLPISIWMINRAPAVITLQRN